MFSNSDIYLAGKNSVCIDSGEQINLNSKIINLGLQANQNGVLGNKLQHLLSNIVSVLNSHDNQLVKISTHVHPVVSIGAPTSPSPTITYTKSPVLSSLKDKIKNIISKIVKLK